jgi:hypothetical protein
MLPILRELGPKRCDRAAWEPARGIVASQSARLISALDDGLSVWQNATVCGFFMAYQNDGIS